MKVVVFLGPTLARVEAAQVLDATFLAPVAQGDVFRVAKEGAFAIGLIDGYFDRMPAVWHKEILWALTQGIHVLGGASMGAIRASELDLFGMRGVGAIYEAFRSGRLEDDDEVAVAHGDVGTGYRATSEAMVNIRATLELAEQRGVLHPSLRVALERHAKGLFYPDRTFARLLDAARSMHRTSAEVEGLGEFLRRNRVDQKRNDALAVLEALANLCVGRVAPVPTKFSFAHTEAWDQVLEWGEGQPPLGGEEGRMPATSVAAEVRVSGSSSRWIIASGYNRAASSALGRRTGVPALGARIEEAKAGLRRWADSGQDTDAGFSRWLGENGMSADGYDALAERQAAVDWLKERFRSEVARYVVDELRANGMYVGFAKRAQEKERVLGERGLAEPTLADAGMTQAQLVSWFAERTGFPVLMDLHTFLGHLGIANVAQLQREALRELLFMRLTESGENARK